LTLLQLFVVVTVVFTILVSYSFIDIVFAVDMVEEVGELLIEYDVGVF